MCDQFMTAGLVTSSHSTRRDTLNLDEGMGGEHTTEKVDSTSIPTSAPSMSAPRHRTIRTCHLSPLTSVNQMHVEIIEERRQCAIIILATKQEQLIPI